MHKRKRQRHAWTVEWQQVYQSDREERLQRVVTLIVPQTETTARRQAGRNQMQKQVALYARVSSDRQVEEGTIDSQLASLQTYSDDHRSTIDADMIFIDDGFSGATLARPGLDALRDRAMMGAIDEVLVLAPDRLARLENAGGGLSAPVTAGGGVRKTEWREGGGWEGRGESGGAGCSRRPRAQGRVGPVPRGMMSSQKMPCQERR